MTETAPRRPYARRMPREQRREQILDAAIAIINRDGYPAVSIDAIAKEAGVTRPVVYGAFEKGLGALLMVLLDRQQQRAMDQLLGVLPGTFETDAAPPYAWVEQTVRRLAELIRADPVTWRPILLPPHGTPAQVQARIDGDRQRVRDELARLITLVLGEEADTEVLSHAVLAIMEHFGRLILEQPDRFDSERLLASVRLMLHRPPGSTGQHRDDPEPAGSTTS